MSVRNRHGLSRRRRAFALAVVALVAALGASAGERFPEQRVTTLGDAMLFVAGPSSVAAHPCATVQIEASRQTVFEGGAATRRALTLLQRRPALTGEALQIEEGVTLRYSSGGAGSAGSEPPAAVTDAVRRGVTQSRALLAKRLGLTLPDVVEVVMLDLPAESQGYLVSAEGRGGRAVIVLDSSPGPGGFDPRRALVHQYAHAAALSLGAQFPLAWSEAFATWAEITADRTLDAATSRLLSRRLARLDQGLFGGDLALAAGNAVWLSFLEEAYGPAVLRRALAELSLDPSAAAAMDRALRASGHDLVTAFREFQLWALFTGERADRYHLSYAADLLAPAFASTADGLPALSVQADPAVAPWGATQIRIRPGDARGGMRIYFEGEFGGRWQADLLLIGRDGTKLRLPLEVTAEGRGSATVPVDDVAEGFLLLRNIVGEEVPPRRYTYAAEIERGYPFEIASIEAVPAESGVELRWETATEQDLLGFNVLRVREQGGPVVVVNPVWIPALGDRSNPTVYHYLDAAAIEGVAYVYRVQGITKDGLTRVTDPVGVRPSAR